MPGHEKCEGRHGRGNGGEGKSRAILNTAKNQNPARRGAWFSDTKTSHYTCRAGSKRSAVVVRAEAGEDLNEKLAEVTETLKEKWAETDDKPAVITLAVYGTIGLVAANGVLKAVDGLPLIPQMLELIGIGFSGFYVYQNLLFKPDRAALKDQLSKQVDKIP